MISHLQTPIIVFTFCVCFGEFTKKKGGGAFYSLGGLGADLRSLASCFDCMGSGLQPFHGHDECHSATQHVANFQLKGRESEAAGPFEKLVCFEWHLSAT